MSKILDLNPKEDAKKKIVQLKKEIDKYQAIIDKQPDLFDNNTYSKVCKALGEKELTIKDFSFLPLEQRVKALAFHQIKNIEKLFNAGSTNNYWYPYFNRVSGGLVFYYSIDCSVSFFGLVGLYKDRVTSDFVGKTFVDIYKILQ